MISMKRLTISLPDDLFEKLNEIENKSHFVRELIENHLNSAEPMETQSSLVEDNNSKDFENNKDLSTLFDELNVITKKIEVLETTVFNLDQKINIQNANELEQKVFRDETQECQIDENKDTIDTINYENFNLIHCPKDKDFLIADIGDNQPISNSLSIENKTFYHHDESSLLKDDENFFNNSPQNSNSLKKNLLAYIPIRSTIKKDVVTNLLAKKYNVELIEEQLEHL
ncbi:hypothetical protein D5R95_03130, partial [Methanosalsum natronophilum]